MRVELPLYGNGYEGDSSTLNSSRTINLYPEKVVGEVDSKVALIGVDGLERLVTIGIGPHRGVCEHLGNLYFVSGNTLYKYDTNQAVTTIGTLNTSGGSVSMASNGVSGNELIIVDGTDGYIYNGSTLTAIADADFPASPTKVVFFDGYFVVIEDNSDYYYISAAYDGTSWSNLDKARAERDPDNIIGIAAHERILWLIGEHTTELWYNSGNDFPFDPIPNSIVEVGTISPDSVAHAGEEGILWLAYDEKGTFQVVKTEGSKVKPVTPSSIVSLFETYDGIENATAFVYQRRGHVFYVLTFPDEDKTWVYDITQDKWHERESHEYGRFEGSTYIFWEQMHLIGDFQTGNVYKLLPTVYTDNSRVIRREFRTYHVADKGQLVRHNYIELEVETGMSLISGQGSDPKITMEFSDNDGKTWSYARTKSLGAQGNYNEIIRWTHLGSSRNRVYRFTMSDPVKWRIKALFLDTPQENTERPS